MKKSLKELIFILIAMAIAIRIYFSMPTLSSKINGCSIMLLFSYILFVFIFADEPKYLTDAWHL